MTESSVGKDQEQKTAEGETPTSNEAVNPSIEPFEGEGDAVSATPGPSDRQMADEWKSKASYLMAEIDNMRKRFIRERSELIKLANEGLLRSLLPVVDNLELALRAAKEAEAKLGENEKSNPVLKSLFQGVEMTLKHMESTLEHIGVKAVKAVGQNFDPTIHEAVGHVPSEHPEGHVAQEIQRGFSLHDRVLRPARVVISKKADA